MHTIIESNIRTFSKKESLHKSLDLVDNAMFGGPPGTSEHMGASWASKIRMSRRVLKHGAIKQIQIIM